MSGARTPLSSSASLPSSIRLRRRERAGNRPRQRRRNSTPSKTTTPRQSASRRPDMFTALARFDIRFRWLVIGLWIVGVVVATRALPNLASVTNANNAGFLSADAPSQQAATLAAPFQGPKAGASALLVAARAAGPLTDADNAAIDDLERRIGQVSGVTLI